MITGIDPGANTGVAIYYNGKLATLNTLNVLGVLQIIRDDEPDLVVIEDSTLTSHVFTAPGIRHAAAMKLARNIGEVDACCKLIKQVCGDWGIPYASISPKNKGKKVDAKEFERITGWTSSSNQHERDAAMVAWRFRNTKGGIDKANPNVLLSGASPD